MSEYKEWSVIKKVLFWGLAAFCTIITLAFISGFISGIISAVKA
jgi:hypothetical protein